MSGNNLEGFTSVRTHMGLEVLKAQYRSKLAHNYAPRYYYQRVRTFLSEFGPPVMRRHTKLQRFLAGLRSAVRLGIVGRERVRCWQLIAWTLFVRPRLMPQALTLAIYGYHFRRVAELHVL